MNPETPGYKGSVPDCFRPRHFNVNAAIRLKTGNDFGTLRTWTIARLGLRLCFTSPACFHPIGRNIFADQVVLDRIGAPLGQFLVVGIAAKAVCVAGY